MSDDFDPDLELLDDETRILVQLPPQPLPLPWDMDQLHPFLGDDNEGRNYCTEPANLRTVPLMKTRYPEKRAALLRARALCLGTGERLYRFFETGRAWVAQVTPGPLRAA